MNSDILTELNKIAPNKIVSSVFIVANVIFFISNLNLLIYSEKKIQISNRY